ncbi:sensor histidine kinase [Rickettsiella endosymbiont of Dermanyssus gallinae]|uniref:sensor histidine kinase n=1 Tax=Rickettsiella endosymbiont of Dermanyssus gallinae TaxID=2856608 RepID=UPI001C529580|nr:HAMP domain-containing sensor histidine kinase [Rickettsiella endosymbiont of Dermanyssus gallinae]
MLDTFGVNYSAFDIKGNSIIQNKSMQSTISKGEVIAEKIDQSAWENCKKIMKSLKEEITEEEFEDKYYLSMKQPIMENNQCVGIVIISFDITEKKQAEQAKSAFVMNMAHDIRTPFSAIVGLAQCQAMYGLKTPEEVKDNGTIIYQSGNQLLEILDSVIIALEKNNIDDIKKDKIALYEFAQEMEELIKPSISINGLEFELQVDKNIGEIVSDNIRLKQILANLLSNAVKFTPKGKVILSFERTTGKLKIEVSDTGIGIDKSNHDRIFEQYEKIKPSYKSSEFTGVGMGLYLVKQLVEKLNGKISLTSSLGNGSTFQVEIPAIA